MRSQHQFSQVPRADIPRSSFNLSHGLKTTFDVDFLIPILVQDIIPGDTWNTRCSFFMRLATPLHPLMDNLHVESFFFFVPYRILWTNFEKFHGAQDDPGDSIDFTIPVLNSGNTVATGELWDYMGLPLGLDDTVTNVSALPFRAYRKIYNDWFRDENLQASLTVATDNGPDSNAESGYNDAPLKRGKRFDYFTSCLTSPQKGSAVSLPLGTSAPIFTDSIDNEEITVGEVVGAGGTTVPVLASSQTFLDTAGAAGNPVRNSATEFGSGYPTNVNLYADLTNSTAATINDIRLAFQTQRLLERDARAGTRYVESLKAHWGVTSPDHRLQRAEFLGGGSSQLNVTPVAQTSGQTTPVAGDTQGALTGFGTVSGTHGFSKSFVEHGVLLGLINVRGDITYSQGLDRYWSKSTRFDFFYPVLSQIGEQSVLNKELFHTAAQASNDLVFGYQERYAEYRHINSKLSGLFRPDASSTLASWHLSEDFASLPTLGSTFIVSNTGVPLDRAIAIATEPHLIADFFFNIKAARPMPTYGVPGNIDRL